MVKLAARLRAESAESATRRELPPRRTEPESRAEPAASASARECAHSASANVLQPHATLHDFSVCHFRQHSSSTVASFEVLRVHARAIFSPLDALKLSRRARNLRRGISERALADSNVDQPTLVVELIRVALQARETNVHCQSSIPHRLTEAIRPACAQALLGRGGAALGRLVLGTQLNLDGSGAQRGVKLSAAAKRLVELVVIDLSGLVDVELGPAS